MFRNQEKFTVGTPMEKTIFEMNTGSGVTYGWHLKQGNFSKTKTGFLSKPKPEGDCLVYMMTNS